MAGSTEFPTVNRASKPEVSADVEGLPCPSRANTQHVSACPATAGAVAEDLHCTNNNTCECHVEQGCGAVRHTVAKLPYWSLAGMTHVARALPWNLAEHSNEEEGACTAPPVMCSLAEPTREPK